MRRSKLELGRSIFNKSGFFFRLEVRGVLPAFRGAGFCSGPELFLKWSFLNYLKGLCEVVPLVASGATKPHRHLSVCRKGTGEGNASTDHIKLSKHVIHIIF